jgi:hypothetical protein
LFLFDPDAPGELGLDRRAFHSSGIGSRFLAQPRTSALVIRARVVGVGNRQTQNADPPSFEQAAYLQVKADLHRKTLDKMDMENPGRTTSDIGRDEVLALIRNLVSAEAVPLSFAERERLAGEMLDEVFGLGPLEPLLKDPTVSDILVNRYDRVYVERGGKLEHTSFSFKDNAHLMQIIDRIVSRVGRRVDESSPMVDARLADGSRVNAIVPPLVGDPCLSIRRFRQDPIAAGDVTRNGAVDGTVRDMDGIRVAILAQDHERMDRLQTTVARTNLAHVVCSHAGFPQVIGDPIIGEILDRGPEIVIVDVDPKNLQYSVSTIELLRGTAADLTIFAHGPMDNPKNVVAAMRAGASEYLEAGSSEDLSEAFARFLGSRVRKRRAPGSAGGGMPPGGSTPSGGSAPPAIPIHAPSLRVPCQLPPKKMARKA